MIFLKKEKNLSHFVTGSQKIVTGKIVTGTARLPKNPLNNSDNYDQ